jgi:transposase
LVDYGYKGKGVLIHSLVDANGNPLAISTTAANGDERKQVEILLSKLPKMPQSLYADKGYDADWLRSLLAEKYNIISHIPKRSWAKHRPKQTNTQSKRWVVERTFAWYQRKFRRINIKWERKKSAWNAFLNFAIIYLWINKLVG